MNAKKLTIIHTNDLHSQLDQWPYVVTRIRQIKAEAEKEGRDVLLFDIGDHADRVNPVTEGLSGKGNVSFLNELAYDAVTIGNNEGMTFSKDQLNRLYEEADFNVLVGNLKNPDGSFPDWAKANRIFTTASGLKVAVFGVTVAYKLFYEALGWQIADPFTLIEQQVRELREKADVLVCLSHLGLHDDERMAEDFPGIDLILGSHTHHVLEDGKLVNGTWIHQCGRSGAYLGEVSVTADAAEAGLTMQVRTHRVDPERLEKDVKTGEMLVTMKQQADEKLSEVVTELPEPWPVDWRSHSPLSDLLVRGLREWCSAEAAMMSSGVLLDGLEKGPVTRKRLHEICPHPINPAKVSVSGERLLEFIREAEKEEMIEKKIKGFGFRGKILGSMVYDGIEVRRSSQVLQPSDVYISGQPLDRDRVYEVATVDMFTFGWLYPSISTLKEKEYFMPEFLRDVLAWSLSRYAK
ncbi:bifunctional metallophosphatase/5'-nucleotidase [Alteribacter natronophilus]|uniref:bifunctional metallophosphatase/5'-nucleotidase n=1 Tax=Alteribacter natronophilus TaxID=2583810 RepID=UPI00110E7121|nr:bifunctional UDP-sugar hydrolase/5'-nucleotidase [Alteribacter natronophilus]TMW72470.1 bifunctional metallophosphatase/5'-nucleotidase [Alteribacter natronophilus]